MNIATPLDPAARMPAPDAGLDVMRASHRAGRDRLVVGAATSRGPMHADNEDSHSAIDRSADVFVVADGVGSGALGATVSAELVRRLHAALPAGRRDQAAIRRAVLEADRAIQALTLERAGRPGAATVALCLRRGRSAARWLIGWVGDCRIYRVESTPAAAAQLLSLDDTYRHLDEPTPPHGSPDDPARMVGNGAVTAPNVLPVELDAGDALLLCSDGLHRHVTRDEIAAALRHAGDPGNGARVLVEQARARGSRDDATALIVQRKPLADPHPAWLVALLIVFISTLGWIAAPALLAERTPAAEPPSVRVPR